MNPEYGGREVSSWENSARVRPGGWRLTQVGEALEGGGGLLVAVEIAEVGIVFGPVALRVAQ